jgi:hypothetical protein
MKRAATTILIPLVALVATAALTSPADAALRAPQVPVLGGTLQGYLTGVGESINVLTDQEDTQAWAKTSSSTQAHTIQFQGSLNAAAHILGMYNSTAAVPPLFVLMSGAVGPLGFSTATFQSGGNLVVNRFDADANFLSSTVYAGADPNGFGFYLSGPNGTYFTQDFRNPGGLAQALAYRGTGANAGTWWLCWEESSRAAGADDDFDDEVILMESVNPTPVSRTTWGTLKSRFR